MNAWCRKSSWKDLQQIRRRDWFGSLKNEYFAPRVFCREHLFENTDSVRLHHVRDWMPTRYGDRVL